MGAAMPRVKSKASDERYTTYYHWLLAKKALGEIDLDPTAHPERKGLAKRYITKEENCLDIKTKWGDAQSIYANVPFSNAYPFLNRIGKHLKQHPEAVAIIMTHVGAAQTKSGLPFFEQFARAYCHPAYRINFDYPEDMEARNGNKYDCLWTYAGNPRRTMNFYQAFHKEGRISVPANKKILKDIYYA